MLIVLALWKVDRFCCTDSSTAYSSSQISILMHLLVLKGLLVVFWELMCSLCPCNLTLWEKGLQPSVVIDQPKWRNLQLWGKWVQIDVYLLVYILYKGVGWSLEKHLNNSTDISIMEAFAMWLMNNTFGTKLLGWITSQNRVFKLLVRYSILWQDKTVSRWHVNHL